MKNNLVIHPSMSSQAQVVNMNKEIYFTMEMTVPKYAKKTIFFAKIFDMTLHIIIQWRE